LVYSQSGKFRVVKAVNRKISAIARSEGLGTCRNPLFRVSSVPTHRSGWA
jgi:hypothetical protein